MLTCSGLANTLKIRSFTAEQVFPYLLRPHLAECLQIHPISPGREIGLRLGLPEHLPQRAAAQAGLSRHR